MVISPSKICYIIAVILFVLGAFGVGFAAVNIGLLGLAALALGMAVA